MKTIHDERFLCHKLLKIKIAICVTGIVAIEACGFQTWQDFSVEIEFRCSTDLDVRQLN